MNLSPHFTLEELIRSEAGIRLDATEQFQPEQNIIDNLRALATKVLEPVRIRAGAAIKVSSGYRCPRVNKSIGGARNSQHMYGQAADITIEGLSVEDAYQLIKKSGIEFDQLIQEFGHWVHVSYNLQGGNRRNCLRAIKRAGKTVYLPG